MSEDEDSGHLQTWIDPDLAASIVALSLGEASDFETEKLGKLIAEKPELAAYRERIESMDGLLQEISEGGPRVKNPNTASAWRMSEERRRKLAETIGDPTSFGISDSGIPSATRVAGEAPATATDEPKIRRFPWRTLANVAAVVVLLAVLGAISLPVYWRLTGSDALHRVPMLAENTTEASDGAGAEMDRKKFFSKEEAPLADRLSVGYAAVPNAAESSEAESPAAYSRAYGLKSDLEVSSAAREESTFESAKLANAPETSVASALSQLNESMALPATAAAPSPDGTPEIARLSDSASIDSGGEILMSQLEMPDVHRNNVERYHESLSSTRSGNGTAAVGGGVGGGGIANHTSRGLALQGGNEGEEVERLTKFSAPERETFARKREVETMLEDEIRERDEEPDASQGIEGFDAEYRVSNGRQPAPPKPGEPAARAGSGPVVTSRPQSAALKVEPMTGPIELAEINEEVSTEEANPVKGEKRKTNVDFFASPKLPEVEIPPDLPMVSMSNGDTGFGMSMAKSPESKKKAPAPVTEAAPAQSEPASAKRLTKSLEQFSDINGIDAESLGEKVAKDGKRLTRDWVQFSGGAKPESEISFPDAYSAPFDGTTNSEALRGDREKSDKDALDAVQWSNSQAGFGGFASGIIDADTSIRTRGEGNINLMSGWTGDESDLSGFDGDDTAARADIDVTMTGEVLERGGGRAQTIYRRDGRADRFAGIGHGGTSFETQVEGRSSGKPISGDAREWKEGFGSRSGTHFDSIDEFLTPETARTSDSNWWASADRTAIVPEAPRVRGALSYDLGDQTDRLGAVNESLTLSAGGNIQIDTAGTSRLSMVTGSHFGDTAVAGSEVRMIEPDNRAAKGRYVHLGFRDKGKTFAAQRVAPPAGLEEKNATEEAFSTFSLHVSDVSFKLAQAALAKGEWPEAGKVRIEEFVNAFDYGDPNPSQDDKVACNVEQAIHPFLQQRNLLRVAMRTAAAGRAGDTPLRLTFLLDNSGSMERADREETVRRAFALLADQLQPIDQVTLISFARQPRLLADKVAGEKSGELVEVVSNLPSEGGTNLEAALKLAFEKAQEQKADGAQNRIVLLTDGAANLGNAKPESLSAMIESMREEGIAFDAAGIGADGLNDEILEALTRKGDGRYYLLDRPEDADAGFAKQIAGALRPAAKNVKVQVEFNPERVGHYKLLGFEKHRLKKEDFRDDSVDAAEMAAEEAGVAVYQFEARPDGQGDVGFVSVRFRDMSSGEMVEKRWPIPYEPSAPRPDQAAPSMQIATAAALLAAKLNGEPLGETVELGELASLVSSVPEPMQGKERVRQLREMIEQARGLEGN